MSRRQKEDSRNKRTMDATVMWVIVILLAAVITFIVSYAVYGNRLNKTAQITNVQKLSGTNSTGMLNVITNTEISETSKSIGKSVNEMENKQNTNAVQNTTQTKQQNTNTTAKQTTQKQTNSQSNTNKTTTNSTDTQDNKDPSFAKPVDGDVIKDYSADNLIYSNTLQEWTTHLGIDYAADKASIVKAAADGTVKSIKNDPRYGVTVVLEHSNGFTSLYANLLSTEFITTGEKVTQGQTIATVGNTATFEISDQTHLHFEILKNGNNVDPNLYIK